MWSLCGRSRWVVEHLYFGRASNPGMWPVPECGVCADPLVATGAAVRHVGRIVRTGDLGAWLTERARAANAGSSGGVSYGSEMVELGYMELDRRGAELLFQVLTEREEKNSVALASNESFSGWTKTFTDPLL